MLTDMRNAFDMTRRDFDDSDLRETMRDSFDYMRGQSRDMTFSADRAFGEGRSLAGLLAGGAVAGLATSLLGVNLGKTPIPTSFVPAAIGYAVSGFNLGGTFNDDIRNAANGALITGVALWVLSTTVKARATQTDVTAGAPQANQIGACAGQCRPLTEAEMIAISGKY